MCTWCSTIQWSGEQMEAWGWNDAWKSASAFTCLEDWMLLTDVLVVQGACSWLYTEICVFISLISSVTFTFSVGRGNSPSYGLREACLGEHMVWTHLLPELVKPSTPWRGAGPRVPLLWTSQISRWPCPLLTGPNIAIPKRRCPLGSQVLLFWKSSEFVLQSEIIRSLWNYAD